MPYRVNGEWWAVAAGLAVAGVGWGVHATLLALAGTLAAVTAASLWVWQHECLTGVTYRRTLGRRRAMFGEEVELDVELVNDKLLPLTWLHVVDDVPRDLTIRGGAVLPGRSDYRPALHHLLPMLPFQRIRRHLTVVCDCRGEHTFGPARLRSGNPAGYRQNYATAPEQDSLLVYPKVFRLAGPTVASRLPLGDFRAARMLIGDPSRPAGVRDYRPGDPLRHIDWRATARGASLLVRVLEPSAALRVAVFADVPVRVLRPTDSDPDLSEFAIAVTASIVADLAGRGVATGLYSSSRVVGRPVAREPSSSPDALPAMLELLARCVPSGPDSFAPLLMGEGARLRRGASAVVIAADFADSTLIAMAELRRRLPVTVIWIANDRGRPPAVERADARWEVRYCDDWKDRDVVDLAP